MHYNCATREILPYSFNETGSLDLVYKKFCPEAGPSLDMQYQGSTYLSLLDKKRSEVVCHVLFSLSQWPYGNTFHCTHSHKSAENATKHPHNRNSPQTVTAINGIELSWELQILV